jgi:DNA-directed RNA polymerase
MMTDELLQKQHELERDMFEGGIARATATLDKAEAAGEANRNPYTKGLYAEFLRDLSGIIHSETTHTTGKAGRHAAHVSLLKPLDPDSVALLAIRTIVDRLFYPKQGDAAKNHGVRAVAYAVGTMIHNELVLAFIYNESPELYATLSRDFNRRHSKNIRHKMTVFKMQAAANDISYQDWSMGDREKVGLWIVDQLCKLGMLVMDTRKTDEETGRTKALGLTHVTVAFSEPVQQYILEVRDTSAMMAPIFGPCVVPPKPWSNLYDGGWHTRDMQRRSCGAVKVRSVVREKLKKQQMPKFYQAMNAQQNTAWAINERVLDAILAVAAERDSGEVLTQRDAPKPPPPSWLRDHQSKDDMNEAEQREFLLWKAAMRDWYTNRKLRISKLMRFHSALSIAQRYKQFERLYFVYFADSRGRLYPMTSGISPQGSDIQKAMLHFADGKPLHTPEAVRWFCIQGANKWGFDKAPLDDRASWYKERHHILMAIASDPVNNREWEQADCPLQFLAWCFEYAEWQIDPQGFESRIPISMDGSCNGLQHFSAMLRDEVGGQAVNLTVNEVMEDIYRKVAEVAARDMAADANRNPLADKWLALGISRSVVKRSVMTTPYGVTKRSAIRYVIDDYLSSGSAPCFEPAEYYEAASVLMDYAWPAIGKVVVKAREAMDWLAESARKITRAGLDDDAMLEWETPSGFLATQNYFTMEEHRIRSYLAGTVSLVVNVESNLVSIPKHATGLAPNFVHSCDAAHLHLATCAANDAGISSLAMIHDDYGTHAADAEKLFHIIRQTFVAMYSLHDPLMDFHRRYVVTSAPPAVGNLDLNDVLSSDYFFS